VVRSLACATSQEKHLRQRVARAVTELNALDEHKQGKQPFSDEAAAYHATAAILAKPRVEGLVYVTVRTDVREHVKRRYGTRPAPTVRRERVRVGAANAEAPLAQAVRRLGWRVYATNHTAEEVGLPVLCQEGLPLRHERFAVGPARDHKRFLGALHRG